MNLWLEIIISINTIQKQQNQTMPNENVWYIIEYSMHFLIIKYIEKQTLNCYQTNAFPYIFVE